MKISYIEVHIESFGNAMEEDFQLDIFIHPLKHSSLHAYDTASIPSRLHTMMMKNYRNGREI